MIDSKRLLRILILCVAALGFQTHAENVVTILTGTVEPECGLTHVLLLKQSSHPGMETVLRIPVKDGRFFHQMTEPVT